MNYAWEAALTAEEQGVWRGGLRFVQMENPSPYMEIAFENLNTTTIEEAEIPVNFLFRFSQVFSRILDINVEEYRELRDALMDVLMHYFVQVDLRQGLCRSEYYIRFLLRDILGGALGRDYAKAIREFTALELKKVLFCILMLYQTGTSIFLFRKAIKAVYPDSLVYASNDTFREVLIYIGQRETAEHRLKVDFLTSVFLNLNYEIHLFWDHHFGIIDVEETLSFDDMVIF